MTSEHGICIFQIHFQIHEDAKIFVLSFDVFVGCIGMLAGDS